MKKKCVNHLIYVNCIILAIIKNIITKRRHYRLDIVFKLNIIAR